MPPPQYMTRADAENIAMRIFQDYEREVVEPRHKETQNTLRRIERIIWIGYGVLITIVFITKLLWK